MHEPWSPRPSNLDQCVHILEIPSDWNNGGTESFRYEVSTFSINTMWYGVPQNRTRIFIVGVKDSTESGKMPARDILAEATSYLRQIHLPTALVETCLILNLRFPNLGV